MPDAMATIQLIVVILPKTMLRSRPEPSRPLEWYSEIIQASKTLKRRVVHTPPQSRPRNRINMSSLNMDRQVAMYSPQ